jgi:serine/threonine-protein kinase
MESTPKGFRVELDASLKLCFLKVWGVWGEEDGLAYVEFFSRKLAPFVGTEFDIVADISEFPIQKPEVNAQIQATMRHAAASGMKRAANIVNSAMTKFQINRLSEETGLPEFSFFKSVEDGVKWLRPDRWQRSFAARGGWS